MSEYLGERLPNVADRVKHLQDAQRALSVDGKSLAEIHPSVSSDVDTDTSSPNFGRIKNPGTAENMADIINGEWDGSRNRFVDQNVDVRMGNEIAESVAVVEGEEAGRKAKADYLITQGYEQPIEQRSSEIFHDQYHRMVNPVAALGDIVKSIRARRNNKKD